MDLNEYWQEVKRVEAKLPEQEIFHVTSQNNREKGTVAGRVSDMTNRKDVARRLVENTHRLSTPEEIERFHQDQKRQTEELAAIELKRKQQFALPQELQTLVALAAQSVLASGETNKKKEK